MIETPISVYSRREVGNDLRWQVSTQEELIPTSATINSCDCEGPSLDRETESIPLLIHPGATIAPAMGRVSY